MDSNKEEIIGKVIFPLEKIDNQDEYEISIDIPNEYNTYNSASIKAKIQFIRSYYKHFQELGLKTENNITNFELSLKESQKLFDNLNGILIFIILKNLLAFSDSLITPKNLKNSTIHNNLVGRFNPIHLEQIVRLYIFK